MYILADASGPDALAILSQSSGVNLPVLRLNISTLASEHNNLYASCSFDISKENITTLFPSLKAACSAMLRAKVVLPIDGLAAISTISPFWNPEVISSKSLNPEPTPVSSPSLLNIASICSKPLSRTTLKGSKSFDDLFSDKSNIFFSAESITFSTSS